MYSIEEYLLVDQFIADFGLLMEFVDNKKNIEQHQLSFKSSCSVGLEWYMVRSTTLIKCGYE